MAKRTPDELAYIAHNELNVPVSIYFERRRNTRISIGSDSVHLRLPKGLSKKDFDDQISWAQKWLYRRLEKAPVLLERFKTVYFRHMDRVRIMDDIYVLHITYVDQKTAKATLKNQDIFIALSSDMSVEERNKAINSLTHKLLCQRYLVFMKKRVRELNEKFFRQPYGRVQLKYIQSKWGSCSSDGDIVLSSKLLLCPNAVLDYIIVHELAHLIEHNHSAAFWKLVEDALPDYRKSEKWLNEEGVGLEIRPLQYRQAPSFKPTISHEIEMGKNEELKLKSLDKSQEESLQTPTSSQHSSKELLATSTKAREESPVPDEPQEDIIAPPAAEIVPATLFPDLMPETTEPSQKNHPKRKAKKKSDGSRNEQLSLF
jgi:predicted metal-dependent hydrolase